MIVRRPHGNACGHFEAEETSEGWEGKKMAQPRLSVTR